MAPTLREVHIFQCRVVSGVRGIVKVSVEQLRRWWSCMTVEA